MGNPEVPGVCVQNCLCGRDFTRKKNDKNKLWTLVCLRKMSSLPATATNRFFNQTFVRKFKFLLPTSGSNFGFNLPPSNSVMFVELKTRNPMAWFWRLKTAKVIPNRISIRSIESSPRALRDYWIKYCPLASGLHTWNDLTSKKYLNNRNTVTTPVFSLTPAAFTAFVPIHLTF